MGLLNAAADPKELVEKYRAALTDGETMYFVYKTTCYRLSQMRQV